MIIGQHVQNVAKALEADVIRVVRHMRPARFEGHRKQQVLAATRWKQVLGRGTQFIHDPSLQRIATDGCTIPLGKFNDETQRVRRVDHGLERLGIVIEIQINRAESLAKRGAVAQIAHPATDPHGLSRLRRRQRCSGRIHHF